MFGVDWSNSQTLWLNITNLALGIATVLALGALGYGLLGDLLAMRKRSHAMGEMDGHMRDLMGAGSGAHLMPVEGMGLTMADGGEPLPNAAKPEAEPSPAPAQVFKPRKRK